MRFLVALLCATALCAATIDYETARFERRLQAIKTTEPIVLDGRLEELAWDQAAVASSFIQNEPRTDEPASETTQVRILYDQENLYIGVYAHDSEPARVIVSDLKKDFNRTSGDSFQIVLDTFHDERNGYQFAINPGGAKWDAQVTNEGRQVNEDWDAVWSVETRMVEDGWTAEIAIPFKTLKFRDTERQSWGINFQRTVRRKNEDSFWSPLPRIYDVNRVSLAGTLEDMEGVRPGSNVRIKPYIAGAFGKFTDGHRNWTGDAGIDLKYAITSGLTWDFTYNTDFSQVEADNQQINLTRFSTLFPEKREFFLENAGIFQFSGGADDGPNYNVPPNDMLFFQSRQIGLAGEDTPTPGAPIPILGGTRLTGRAGRYELGVLNIQQRRQGSLPATNFTVARLRRNILTNSDVGVMFNNKQEQDSSHFNRALGVDANLRLSQPLSVYAYLAKTFFPNRGSHDLAGRVAALYVDSAWTLRSSYVNIEQDFNNEMGYVPRPGMRMYSGFAGRVFRPTSLRDTVRRLYPHWKLDYLVNPDGELETRSVNHHFILELQSGASGEIGRNEYRELLVEPFQINRRRKIVIPPGVYNFYEYLLMFNTDNSRRLSANTRTLIGPYYTGYRHSYTLGGTLRLNHQFNTSFNYTHNNINLREGHYKTNLLTMRAYYSFSTKMFLNALVQYNSDTQQWSSNIRFDLIHRPLSDIFLVYNERRSSVSGDLIDRAVIAKITYMIVR